MRITIKTMTGNGKSNSKPAMSFDPVTRNTLERGHGWVGFFLLLQLGIDT